MESKPANVHANNSPEREVRTKLLIIISFLLICSTAASAQRIKKLTDEDLARERRITVEQVRELKAELGASNEVLSQLSEQRLRQQLLELRYPDLPRLRASFLLLKERDASGNVPTDALPKALQQLDSLRARANKNIARMPTALPAGGPKAIAGRLLLPPTAGLFPDHSGWEALGPINIGGRVRSIVFEPGNENKMWIGSVGGGVWHSTDGGKTFKAVDDLMANLAVSCLAIDPSNPKIIYAGTGEGVYGGESIPGAGIFRTIDGTKWEQVSSTIAPAQGSNFQYVNRLAVSTDGKVLLAATRSGLFRSEDSDRLKWSQPLTGELAFVAFHPTDNLKAIAAGFNGNAYYSPDGGITWHPATHTNAATGRPIIWTGRVELTYALKNPKIVYAAVARNSGEIWQSSDGGESYSKKGGKRKDNPASPAGYLGKYGWYANSIWAGDKNEKLVIVGGVDLWKSEDGGDTLIEISTWDSPKSAHADHHAIVPAPGYGTTNKRIYFGNDGGIFKTEDASTVGNDPVPPRINGWVSLNSSLPITQFYGAAANTRGIIIGGSQDTGTLRYDTTTGNQQWSETFGGDGGWCAADPNDPNYLYGEYIYLNIHRSTDAGATTDTLGDRYISGQYWNPQKINQKGKRGDWDWKDAPYRIDDAMTNNALFIAPFVLDPNNSDRILAGGLRLWRTNDAKAPNDGCTGDPNATCTGPEWSIIKDSVGSMISAIAVTRNNPDVIWVGHERGEIYKTTEGTKDAPNWPRVGETQLPPGRFCTGIEIDPNDSETVYLTYGRFEKGAVWKTPDGGINWSNIGNDLPDAPVYCLTIHPRNSKFIYVGTGVGVFASEDGGAHWSPTNEGPTSCAVNDFFWMGDTLVAVTNGRGMFKIDLTLSGR